MRSPRALRDCARSTWRRGLSQSRSRACERRIPTSRTSLSGDSGTGLPRTATATSPATSETSSAFCKESGPFNLDRDQGYNFRIADFGSITEWVAPAIGIADWKGLLERANQEQREFIKEGDWLLPLLQLWLDRTPGQQGLEGQSDIRWVGKDELHAALVALAKEKDMPYWVQSGQGLATRLGSSRDAWQGEIRLHGPERMSVDGKRPVVWGIEPW